MSINNAYPDHRRKIAKNPAKNDDNPLLPDSSIPMMKAAVTALHQGKNDCNSHEVIMVSINWIKNLIFQKVLKFVRSLFDRHNS